MSDKREDYISWDEYFMAVAQLAGMRSKDPHTQVGACIVSEDNKILSMGYNGFPRGCSDDEFPWGKTSENPLENKYLYTTHSELNAILNYRGGSLEGAKLYVTLFPCNECCKAIIQAGITEVIYYSDKYADTDSTIAAKRMFDMVGITYRQYQKEEKELNEMQQTLSYDWIQLLEQYSTIEELQAFKSCTKEQLQTVGNVLKDRIDLTKGNAQDLITIFDQMQLQQKKVVDLLDLRFEDENEKLNLSLMDIKGEILSISQFTLYANCKKGRRPSFLDAAKPEISKPLYEYFNKALENAGVHTETGIFGAMMKVSLINDGPTTIILDSKEII